MNEFKVVLINYRNMPARKLLQTIKTKEWEYADWFQASSPEEAAEVVAEDYMGDDGDVLLFAVKEKGKSPVVIEVHVTMMPEFNSYRYKYRAKR